MSTPQLHPVDALGYKWYSKMHDCQRSSACSRSLVTSAVYKRIVWIVDKDDNAYRDKRNIWCDHFHHEDDEDICAMQTRKRLCACVLSFTKTTLAQKITEHWDENGATSQIPSTTPREDAPRREGQTKSSRHLDAVEGAVANS